MVVLLASISSVSVKSLVSRQFVEMNHMRVEGLLAAFPKLAFGNNNNEKYSSSSSPGTEGPHRWNLLHDLPKEATPTKGWKKCVADCGHGCLIEVNVKFQQKGGEDACIMWVVVFGFIIHSLTEEGCERRGISLAIRPLMIAKRGRGVRDLTKGQGK